MDRWIWECFAYRSRAAFDHFELGQRRISFFSARDFNIREMKADNVILLGSSRAKPWMELLEDRLNFRCGYGRASHYAHCESCSPKPGDQRIYRRDSSVSYCQIAFLPNLGRTGNILVVGGAEVEGTEGGPALPRGPAQKQPRGRRRARVSLDCSANPQALIRRAIARAPGASRLQTGFIPVLFLDLNLIKPFQTRARHFASRSERSSWLLFVVRTAASIVTFSSHSAA